MLDQKQSLSISGRLKPIQKHKNTSTMKKRFFGVTETLNWREKQLDYKHGKSHKDIAASLPLPSSRITNERFREIETTGHYYRISELKRGGASFIFEVTQKA